MAKKKHAEEHENLERWLVSYADFMTLLFATFVVLYALAQTDVNSYKGLEESLRKAFSQNIFDNQANIMDGKDSILDGAQGVTNPLMLEYLSPKYEQTSYEEIKEDVDSMKKEGITAEIDDRGLVIRLDDNALRFMPGSADINPKYYDNLSKIAESIKKKFLVHIIEIDGHSDSDKVSSSKYPSNWELSSARASSVVRFFIDNHDFNKNIFVAAGLADTVPLFANNSPINKTKNRRVEIVIRRNKNKNLSRKNMDQILKEAKLAQKKKENDVPPEILEQLLKGDSEILKNSVDITDRYKTETKRLDSLENNDFMHDGEKPDFLKNDEQK